MNLKALHNLRHTLEQAPLAHLSDERLAELAAAETAGEDIEQVYPAETAHLETCVLCAEAYAGLMEITLAAFGEMAEAAAAVSPLEVYAAILQRALQPWMGETPTLVEVVRRIAGGLPALITRTPAAAEDVHPETIAAAAGQTLPSDDLTPDLLRALTQAVRQNLAALSLYLRGAAGSIWGRAVRVQSTVTGGWGQVGLSLVPRLVQPILGEAESATDEWELASTRVGRPLPVNVTLHAERLSPVACRLVVRADRPGLPDAAGRAIELHFAGQTLTAQTDAGGFAHFEPVPVAAVENLEIRFRL